MADFKKIARAAALKILKHNGRQSLLTIEQYTEIGSKRENIDSAKTHLNYDLAVGDRLITAEDGTEKVESPLEKYSRRFSEIETETNGKFTEYIRRNHKTGEPKTIRKKLSIRADAVSLCGWIVTAPKDLPPNEEAQFFQTAYDFIANKYGRENIISADVHYDEATPHIHITFIPIVTDKKNGGNKLCADGLETPKTLSKFHQQLSDVMADALGHKVGVLNGATVGGNLSITQLKLRDTLQKLAHTEVEITKINAEKELQDLLEKVSPALFALDSVLENRGFFKKNPEKQFKQVLAFAREATAAMQEIKDFPQKLDELGANASQQLDTVLQQSIVTTKQAEEQLRSWHKRLQVKDDEMYAEVDAALDELCRERETFRAEKAVFAKEKAALVKQGVAESLAKSEQRTACMQVSDAWLKRTGGIFEKNMNLLSEKENDYDENEDVSTDNGGHRTQKPKPALRNQQMHGKN